MKINIEVMDKKEIELLDHYARKMLIEIGVKIPNKIILNILREAGAKVGKNNFTAKFSEEMIINGLKGINKNFCLFGRDLNNIAKFKEGNINFLSTAGQFAIIDLDDGKRRIPLVKDMIDGIRLAESLENINIVGAFVVPQDIEIKKRDLFSLYYLLNNTKKPFAFWINSGESSKKIINMLEVFRGSKENLQKYPPFYAFIDTFQISHFIINYRNIKSHNLNPHWNS